MKRIGAVTHPVTDELPEMSFLYVCEDCGAVVNSVPTHRAWHEQHERALAAVFPSEF